MEHKIGRCSVSSNVGAVPDPCGEKGAEMESKPFNLPVYLPTFTYAPMLPTLA